MTKTLIDVDDALLAKAAEALGTSKWLATEDGDFRRAIEVQGLPAAKANHRAASISDLLVAAVAERHRVTLVHYDADFDLIARHTAQPTRWIVPRGTLP